MSVIKKFLPQAHLEIAFNPQKCIEYCQKEETRQSPPETFGTVPVYNDGKPGGYKKPKI